MEHELLAHQDEGVSFLIHEQSGLLAFEQGLGKSFVAIEAFRRVLASGLSDRMLVVCPNSLKRNWVAEFKKFAPSITTEVAEGPPRQRRSVFQISKAQALITSYETVRAETTALLAFVGRQRTVLVLDESHAAKNWRSQTSTAMRNIAPRCTHRWLLSGTPVTNTATDLFTQIKIIEPNDNTLGSLESFSAQLADDPKATFAREAIDRLVLRKTKEQCLDLPRTSLVDIRIELPPWQRKLYDEMRDDMVCKIETMTGEQYRVFAQTALARLSRLIQISCNPSMIFPDINQVPAKFLELDSIISDILSVPDRKVILWSHYIKSIEMLCERFEGSVAIYGGTPVSSRQDVAFRFQNDPDVRVLIANPAAAGTGFTLTSASYAIYESLSWRYDHYTQSRDRNHRIGQTKPVTYIRLLAADTIEDAVASKLKQKSTLSKNLLGDTITSSSVAQLSRDEMCDLLKGNNIQ